ncbi:lysylphosphatidylglycerol synthase domain-containing protein [Lichenicoccus sp.]|uniref:lysylphosphatidylglycerol synthase domain-containing protein n=1 Tax=Lichenicoccus sp. TaxID=2781899 RepID=UPI003D09A4FD
MKPWLKRLGRHFPHFLGLLLLAGAVFVVQREFRHLSLDQVRAGLRAIPRRSLLISAGFTLLSFFVLSFYDRLAVIHVGHRLAFRRTFFAAFCSYVLSHNLGVSALSGAAVRFRLYGIWGLSPADIAQIVAFCSVTFALGACALVGGVLIIEPGAIPVLAHAIPHALLRLAGVAAWGTVVAYVALSRRRTQFRLWRLRIEMPGPRMAIGQVVVASLDVGATAAIAFSLLPPTPDLGYPTFLAIYIASYTAGLVASVPGGLGVFDGAMLLGLSAWLPAPSILGMILVFRMFYYIVPLFIAGALFAGHELLLRSDAILGRLRGPRGATSLIIRQSEADFSVTIAVGAVSLCGAMLLALGVLDPGSDLAAIIPPSAALFEGPPSFASWLTGLAGDYVPSLIGAALMGLAIGLSNRVTLAWGATIVLLCVAALLTALRGNIVLIPGILILAALLIAPFRGSYYRHARLLSEPLAPGTTLPLLLLIGCVLILGRLEPHVRALNTSSFWSVVLTPGASNRTRVSLACAVLLMLAALWRLISPGRIATLDWEGAGGERYCALGESAILDIAPQGVVLAETGRAAIAFTRAEIAGERHRDGLLIALGDPVGARSEQVSAIWRLRDLALQEGRDPAFWQVGADLLHLYEDLGLTVWPTTQGGYLACAAERGAGVLRTLNGLSRAPR